MHEAHDRSSARRLRIVAVGCFVFGALTGVAAVGLHRPAPLQAAPRAQPRRSAKEILDEFAANESPGFALDMDPAAFDALLRERTGKQCELALELWRDHFGHPALAHVLFVRWMNLVNFFHQPGRARRETAELLAQHPTGSLEAIARFVRAHAAISDDDATWDDALADVEDALRVERETKDTPGWKCTLLLDLACCRTADPKTQRELLERAGAQAKHEDLKRDVRRRLALLDRIGQPVDLEFDDALDGRHVRLADFRGRCVVLHVRSLSDPEPAHDSKRIARIEPEIRAAHAVLVTIDSYEPLDARAGALATARKVGVRSPLFVDSSAFDETWASRFGLRGVPHVLLVAPDGRLAAVVSRPVALAGKIHSLGSSH
jgi:hypothetical protein